MRQSQHIYTPIQAAWPCATWRQVPENDRKLPCGRRGGGLNLTRLPAWAALLCCISPRISVLWDLLFDVSPSARLVIYSTCRVYTAVVFISAEGRERGSIARCNASLALWCLSIKVSKSTTNGAALQPTGPLNFGLDLTTSAYILEI